MRLLLVFIGCIAPAWAWAADPAAIEIPLGETKLRAVLYQPAGSGPFPTVLGLHGCEGLINARGVPSARYRDWAQRLNTLGFAVIFPDSYRSRGLAGTQCTVRSRAARSAQERVADVQAARTWLLEQPWVARDRISLVGWSNGGITVLWAIRPRIAPTDGKPDFRSAVALYPGCSRLLNTAWSARVPTLLLVAGADDHNRPSECQQMAAGARGRSARVSVHVYPGAPMISTIRAGACRHAPATRFRSTDRAGFIPAAIPRRGRTC